MIVLNLYEVGLYGQNIHKDNKTTAEHLLDKVEWHIWTVY